MMLQFRMPTKKVFFNETARKDTRSIRITENAKNAIEAIAQQYGLTFPQVIEDALEQYLQYVASQGVIPLPEGESGTSGGTNNTKTNKKSSKK